MAEGRVISQSPAPGATVNVGSDVNMTVSLGRQEPDTVAIPDVVGMTLSQAKSTIASAGLTISVAWMSYGDPAPAGRYRAMLD